MASNAVVAKGAHEAAQRTESPRSPERVRFVFAFIICKPEQRQLTTMVPDAMNLAVAQNPDSGASAWFGVTSAPRQQPSQAPSMVAQFLLHAFQLLYSAKT
ncbi:hypothetical protein M3J09_003803 [Ascochyta lentis]